MQPPKHTPLIAVPAVVLDLETTGLDVRKDRIIQIGVIEASNSEKNIEPLIDQLINPGIPIPAASTDIHHIKNESVTGAPYIQEVAKHVSDTIKNRVVIGQHIAFDMAVLKREFARNNLVWHEPVTLDISMLVGALQPALFDVSLESICTYLGVDIVERHTAMGDCLTTLHCWQKLIPLLQEKNVRTLAEAIAFSGLRQDLIMRQMESGWLETPAGLVTTRQVVNQRVDSYVYRHRLSDVMSRPAVSVQPDTALREAAKIMVEHRLGCLLVSKPGNPAQGILTERDMVRMFSEGKLDMDATPVNQVMSTPLECIRQDELLYRGLARMDRLNVSHLCVVDDNGLATGIVSQRNLLQYRARGSNMMYDAMEAAEDVSALAAAFGRVTSVAAQLLEEELSGIEIARVISLELQALVQRASQLAMQRMEQEGQGSAPADWCVLVLGSGGRGESLLSTDQDNALIHTGGEQDDAWFAQFGSYFNEMLNTAGLPFCQGGVMISNEMWRGNTETWNRRVSNWINRANPEDLLNVDIFFDLLPAAGNSTLAYELHMQAVKLASKSHAFINLLAQSVRSVAPQFNLFGRVSLDDGRVDLKRNGLLPLVSFARTIALRIGSTARATPQRIAESVISGRLSEGDGERLISLQKNLISLILRQQLQDSEAGIPVGSKVDIKQLSKREYTRLKHELHHLDTVVSEIQTFTTSN
ncbi:DUF294 nucleotidyltransferase-like domain-containing protein [Kaarinaea lacus]